MRSVLLLILLTFPSLGLAGIPDRPRAGSVEALLAAAAGVRGGAAHPVTADAAEHGKCALWLGVALRAEWPKLSEAQRAIAASFLAPPALQKTRVLGHFRVHYDTTGFNAAAMLDLAGNAVPGTAEEYVDSLGAIFSDVYDREIGGLGYATPLVGGTSLYDVYCSDISYYGFTVTTGLIGSYTPPRQSSYIEIENDFRGFYSPGLAGLRVTAAHEFHHAIQFAGYGFWGGEEYLMEMTSTWMEDVMFPAVDDYIQYLRNPFSPTPVARGQFATPEVSFTTANGSIEYSRAIWPKYIEQRHSAEVVRRIWEGVREVPPLAAMDQALGEVGSSFRQAFLEWSSWNFRTWSNADTLQGYRESALFPPMRVRAQYDYVSPARFYPDSIEALSSAYHLVNVAGRPMLVIISNLDRTVPAGSQRFTYEMQDADAPSFKRLATGISVRVNAADPAQWTSQENVPSLVDDVIAYPNPLLAERASHLTFRLPIAPRSESAALVVVSAGLDRVFGGTLPVVELRPLEHSVVWNARDDRGRALASGIYIFVLSVDGREFRGKFTVMGG